MSIQKQIKIGVMTSGGDAPGMNAAVRSVVRACAFHDIECYGIYQGYEGLINDDIKLFGPRDVSNIINLGGTILKTARSDAFRTKEGRKRAFNTLEGRGINSLVVIGGDGSFTGAKVLYDEFGVKTMGVPGTIDNDIFGTDFTIGYDTALNTAVEAIDKIRDTATSHNRIFFIEVMGRDAGFIALNSGIGSGAQDILIPEEKDDFENLFDALDRGRRNGKKSSIVVVAEGEELAGVYDLAKSTKQKYSDFDIRVTVLGHIQRGGVPSCADRVLASRLGIAAVEALIDGRCNEMAGVRGHKIVYTPFSEAIQKHNEIDKELIRVSEILAR